MIAPASDWTEADYEEAKYWRNVYLQASHMGPASLYGDLSWHARVYIHHRLFLPLAGNAKQYEARVAKIVGALTA